MKIKAFVWAVALLVASSGCDVAGGGATASGADPAREHAAQAGAEAGAVSKGEAVREAAPGGKVQKSDAEWRKLLTPQQYHVLREKGTERAFTGDYYKSKEPGVYVCAACGNELFSSDHKFDSGTGWPSFWQPLRTASIGTESDHGFGMTRTEVTCSRCGGHLGHVFEDGPKPTVLRYCINSAALKLEKRK